MLNLFLAKFMTAARLAERNHAQQVTDEYRTRCWYGRTFVTPEYRANRSMSAAAVPHLS